MFTLLRNRLSVAVVVIFLTVVTVLTLAVTLYASRSPGDPPPAAQSSGAANLISSGSSTNTQDPRFCIVPLEGIERLTGKESTPRPASDPQSALLAHQVSFISGDAPQGTPIPTSPPPDTVTPSPTTCPISAYTISTGTGVIVPGVTDSSVHCDDCIRLITLPFPYTLYNHTFTTASVGSNGTVGFITNSNWSTNSCLPTSINTYEYVIFPFWDDQTTLPSGKGIYTSVSGIAPDRIFNIEFRNCGFSVSGCAPGTDSNYEVRLYENQTRFDVVYGTMGLNGSGATIGVQWNGGWATQYSCNTATINAGMMLTFTYPPCGTLTPTPITTPAISTNTPTAAATVTTATSSQTPTAPGATPTTCTIEFTDVPPGSTFYTYIHCLACMNIVNGYPDGTFRPNNNITRGQLTKIVCNSANCPTQPLPQAFEDVPPGSAFYDQVNTLAYLGYISGYPCGSGGEPCVPPDNRPYFRPINSATRGQISKIISNIAGFNEPIIGQTFEDVPPGSTFYDFIGRLVLHNVINGYPCGSPGEPCVPPENRPYFRPSRHASRGQTSKIVANTFFPNCNPPTR